MRTESYNASSPRPMDVVPQAQPATQPSGPSFADTLAQKLDPQSEKEAALDSAARKFLAQLFYAPMLKQMRKSPFHSDLFDGGKDSEAFTQMFDQRLVDKMARSADRRLVRHIVRQLGGRKNSPAQTDVKHVQSIA